MPSPNMVRHVVDLYPNANEKLEQLLSKHKLKRSRFLRECVNYILSDQEVLDSVITQSRQKAYVKVKR